MCKEDLALGQAMKGGLKTTVVGQTSATVLGPSPIRTAVILCAPLAGTLTYSTQPVAVAGQGIILTAGSGPVRLVLKDHGSLVRDAWFAIADAADRVASVFFVELPDSISLPSI